MTTLDYRKIVGVERFDACGPITVYNSVDYVTNECATTNCRGLVYNGNLLFFKHFPYCIEHTAETIERENINLDKCRIFQCVEGTLIHVYFVNNQWFTTTNKRLDAFKSKWGSVASTHSFGRNFAIAINQLIDDPGFDENDDFEQHKEFLVSFYEKHLDKTKKYSFVLKPDQVERIVCDVDEDERVVLIATFNRENVANFDDDILIDGTSFPKRQEICEKFRDTKQLADFVENEINYRHSQGLIIFQRENGSELKCFKVVNSKYDYRFKLRNNISSLKFCYLNLRMTNDKNQMETFFEMYPQMEKIADTIELEIYEVCQHLHVLYMASCVKHERIVAPKESVALNIIHQSYRAAVENARLAGFSGKIQTTPTIIGNILSKHNPTIINHLLTARRMAMKAAEARQQNDEMIQSNYD